MASQSPPDGAPRLAICIGVGQFRPLRSGEDNDNDFDALEFAQSATIVLGEAIGTEGYEVRVETAEELLRAVDLGTLVTRTIDSAGPNGTVIIHALSHGLEARLGGVYVVGSDAEIDDSTHVTEWIHRVENRPDVRPYTLFLLDLCHAGSATHPHWHLRKTARDGKAWIIAATGANKPAYNGRFTRAVANVITDITANRIDISSKYPYVPLGTVIDLIQRNILSLASSEGGHPQEIVATPVDRNYPTDLPFFRNPRFNPNGIFNAAANIDPNVMPFIDPVLDDAHFRERAAGHGLSAGRVESGCFTGRDEELRKLVTWMDAGSTAYGSSVEVQFDNSSLMVVTGSPGAGKSAILGVLVCAAHPILRMPTRELWRHVAARPSQNSSLAAIHARQRSLHEVQASLHRQLNLDLPGGNDLSTNAIIASIVARPSPSVIIIDAIDEAIAPVELVYKLIIPLVEANDSAHISCCKLMVGLRPWDDFKELFEIAKSKDALIDLDKIPLARRRRELAEYIKTLLELLPEYGDVALANSRTSFSDAVARKLVLKSRTTSTSRPQWGEFLVATLYTHSVTMGQVENGSFIDPRIAAKIGGAVPKTLPAVFELDLSAGHKDPWRRPLLATLAHARGGGMPLSVITAICRALGSGTTAASPSVAEIEAALQLSRFYLRTSTDTDGTVLYRLFHQGLTDYLADKSTESINELFDRIIDHAPLVNGRRRWDVAEPYLLRHAIQHALEAGRANELIGDAEFLVHADPVTLIKVLQESGSARKVASVYRNSAFLHRRANPQIRRQLLALDAARYHVKALLAKLTEPLAAANRWHVRWATDCDINPALLFTLTGHTDTVSAVDFSRLVGLPVVLSGSHDGTVRIWDLTTGEQLGSPLTGHDGPVHAVACSKLSGEPMAASGGADKTLRIWDLKSGKQLGNSLTGHTERIDAIAFGERNGRPVVVSHSLDGTLRVWNVANRVPSGQIVAQNVKMVVSIACASVAENCVVVGASHEGFHMWNLDTGAHDESVIDLYSADKELLDEDEDEDEDKTRGQLTAVRCTLSEDDTPIAVTGSTNDGLSRWLFNSERVTDRELITEQALDVTSVGCDASFVVTGGYDGTVRAWDLENGTDCCGPLIGHSKEITSVVCTEVNQTPIAASASLDQTICVWDLSLGQYSRRSTGHTGTITSLACSIIDDMPIAVSGSSDSTLRVWRTTDGTSPYQPLWSRRGGVTALACVTLDGEPFAVAAGPEDHIQVWNLRTGKIKRRSLTGRDDRVFAMACTEMLDVPVAVTLSSYDDKVCELRAWDLKRGARQLGPVKTAGLSAIACGTFDEKPAAVTVAGKTFLMQLWDLQGGTLLWEMPTGHSSSVSSIQCAQLGANLAVITASYDRTIRVWTLAGGIRLEKILQGHTGRITCLSSRSVYGNLTLVSGSEDKTLRIWDLSSGSVEVIAVPGAVSAVSFIDENTFVAGIGWDVVGFARGLSGHSAFRSERTSQEWSAQH